MQKAEIPQGAKAYSKPVGSHDVRTEVPKLGLEDAPGKVTIRDGIQLVQMLGPGAR